MTIRTFIECDECGETLNVDSSDDVSGTLDYNKWGEDPENGWKHYCDQCLPSILKDYEKRQYGDNEDEDD